MNDFLLHLVHYTIGYGIAYGIAYLFLEKLYKDCPLFKYINSKRSRGVISVLVIFVVYILISLFVSMFNLSENHSNIFSGLSVGIMVLLISKIKYPKNSQV